MIVGVAETSGVVRSTDERLRQAEVQHFHCAIRSELDVRRLEIAMNNPTLVRRFERFSDLHGDRQRLVQWDAPLSESVGERGTLDQLEDQRLRAGRFLEPVDCGDIGVIQRRQNLGFPFEARKAIGIRGQKRGKNFDGHFAIQSRVACAIDLSHAARTDEVENLVDSEPNAGK